MTFYNEIEPYAVAWLKNLSAFNQIAPGVVDARDIRAVAGRDLSGHRQAHFFAGLGGWSYALRLAGWPDEQPVWTGSCPCQPFSAAGRKGGFDDSRHLWPEWFRLIKECRPPVVLGEQVASPDGLQWLDLVSADLEEEGYTFGAADLPAAGVGAPHIRQRLYFVALAGNERREGFRLHVQPGTEGFASAQASGSGEASLLAHAERSGSGAWGPSEASGGSSIESDRHRPAGLVGDSGGEGPQIGSFEDERSRAIRIKGTSVGATGIVRGPWANADFIWCQDGKYRPVESGSFPLAHGVSARVGRLRAYGNAIVAPLAATFVRAVFS